MGRASLTETRGAQAGPAVRKLKAGAAQPEAGAAQPETGAARAEAGPARAEAGGRAGCNFFTPAVFWV
jgi:hypothetical protein